MDHLPVEYHYEFYEIGSGDPFYSIQTGTPLGHINKGDILDWRGFKGLEVPPNSRLRVVRTEHIIWEIEGHHIGHKLMFTVEVVTKSEARNS